jgi:hypothetical protein
MGRVLRHSWQTLAAAVGLGLALGGAGLTVAGPIEVRGRAAGTRRDAEPEPVLLAQDQRVVEIDVELALLADPITFPYNLGARVQGGTVCLRGYVRYEPERDRAVVVARQHCPVSVVNEIKLLPNLVLRPVGGSAAQLQEEAETALHDAFPALASRCRIYCGLSGEITVGGVVGSPEEKLAVSRRLRQLASCSAVLNQLRTGFAVAERGNSPHREASEVVQAANWQPVNGTPDSHDPLAKVPSPAGPEIAPPAGMPMPMPLPPSVTTKDEASTEEPDDSASASAAAQTGTRQETSGTDRIVVDNAESRVALPASPPVRQAPVNLDQRIQSVCGGAASDVRITSRSGTNMAIQMKVRNAAEAERLAAVILGIPELAPFHVDLKVVVEERATAAAPLVPPDAAPTFAERKTNPRSTTPPVPAPIKADDPTTAAHSAVHSASPTPAALKHRVESVCGAAAADVDLVVRSATDVLVKFRVRDAVEGERLAGKVLSMPELAAYHVDLEVKVGEAAVGAITARTPARPAGGPAVVPAGWNTPAPASAAAGVKTSQFASSRSATTTIGMLQQRIEGVCGSAASEVHVTARSTKDLLVQFRAQDADAGEQLASKVLNMPELAAYHVDLDVKVGGAPAVAAGSSAMNSEPVPSASPRLTPISVPVVRNEPDPEEARWAPAFKTGPPIRHASPAVTPQEGDSYVSTGVVVISEPARPGR